MSDLAVLARSRKRLLITNAWRGTRFFVAYLQGRMCDPPQTARGKVHFYPGRNRGLAWAILFPPRKLGILRLTRRRERGRGGGGWMDG